MGIEIEIKNEGKEEEKNSTLNLDIRFIFLLPLYSETVGLFPFFYKEVVRTER